MLLDFLKTLNKKSNERIMNEVLLVCAFNTVDPSVGVRCIS